MKKLSLETRKKLLLEALEQMSLEIIFKEAPPTNRLQLARAKRLARQMAKEALAEDMRKFRKYFKD